MKLAFMGAGKMAGAIVRGIIRSNAAAKTDIVCTSARDGTAELLAADTGISVTYDIEELLSSADWLVLACKPQQLKELPDGLAELTKGIGILSILAGTTLERLQGVFPNAANIVRCMPNTPGMIGQGITAFSPLRKLGSADQATVNAILEALGKVVEMPEAALDAVTGVSGSGPAYVFEFVAALRDGGIHAGLDEETAYKLALQTVKGAAALLEAVPESPETHRNWVSSPGGTTLAGLAVMESADFRSIVKNTVEAAARRSKELSGS